MKYFLLPLLLTVSPIETFASTTSTFDILVATDSLTVVGTATVSGNAFSIGGSTFVAIQGRIGIGTTTPLGELHVYGSTFAPGGIVGITGRGEFVWFSSGAALRVGEPTNSGWVGDVLGAFSNGFGYKPIATGRYSTVNGGYMNAAYGSVGAGNGGYGVVSGGTSNTTYDLNFSAVGGGNGNAAYGQGATVAGGLFNAAIGRESFIGGGRSNFTLGTYSTVAGGYENTAGGEYSFAGGYKSSATHLGSFVWSDYQPLPGDAFASGAVNEFKIRASGGFVFHASTSSATVIVSSGAVMISTSATAASAVPNIFISSINGNVGIGKKSPATTLDVNGDITSSSATYTATGSNIYSLTSSSGIHILAGGITWPDGTTSTTASVGGSNGACYRMNYSSFSAQTSVTFSGLSSSTTYRFGIRGVQNTSDGVWYARFNGDAGSNYKYSGSVIFDQGSPASFYSNGATGIVLVTTQSGNKAKAGTPVDGSFEFSSVWGLPKTIKIYKSAFEYTEQSVPADGSIVSGGRYIGSAALSSILIATDAGTMTGYMELWNCGAWGLQN